MATTANIIDGLAKLALELKMPVRHARGTSGYVLKGTKTKWNPLLDCSQAFHMLDVLCDKKDLHYIASRARERENVTNKVRYFCHIYSADDCVASKFSYTQAHAIGRALFNYYVKEILKEESAGSTPKGIGRFGKGKRTGSK